MRSHSFLAGFIDGSVPLGFPGCMALRPTRKVTWKHGLACLVTILIASSCSVTTDTVFYLDGRTFKLINEDLYELDPATKELTFVFRTFTIEEFPGVTVTLVDGNLYALNSAGRRLTFIAVFYDPDFRRRNYVFQGGKAFLRDPATGMLHATVRRYQDGFEAYNEFQDLFSAAELSDWTIASLESDRTPTHRQSTELFRCVLRRECGFVDNSIGISTDILHAGTKALRTSVVANGIGSSLPFKASISKQNLFFEKGDDVYFSGWYYVAHAPRDLTLFDLESTWLLNHQGIRVLINNDVLEMELKSFGKLRFRQTAGAEIPIPQGKWFNVQIHLSLSDEDNGIVEVWQDGVRIIDETGQTLPLADSVYDSVEIGISAHSRPWPQVVYVDDVLISDTRQ